MTKHNTLRLLGAYALVLLPIALFSISISYVVFGGVGGFGVPETPSALRAYLERQRDNLVPSILLDMTYDLLTTALGVAVLSYAYKSLNGRPLGEPLQAVSS